MFLWQSPWMLSDITYLCVWPFSVLNKISNHSVDLPFPNDFHGLPETLETGIFRILRRQTRPRFVFVKSPATWFHGILSALCSSPDSLRKPEASSHQFLFQDWSLVLTLMTSYSLAHLDHNSYFHPEMESTVKISVFDHFFGDSLELSEFCPWIFY